MFLNGELSHIYIWVHGLVTYKYSDSTVQRFTLEYYSNSTYEYYRIFTNFIQKQNISFLEVYFTVRFV